MGKDDGEQEIIRLRSREGLGGVRHLWFVLNWCRHHTDRSSVIMSQCSLLKRTVPSSPSRRPAGLWNVNGSIVTWIRNVLVRSGAWAIKARSLVVAGGRINQVCRPWQRTDGFPTQVHGTLLWFVTTLAPLCHVLMEEWIMTLWHHTFCSKKQQMMKIKQFILKKWDHAIFIQCTFYSLKLSLWL